MTLPLRQDASSRQIVDKINEINTSRLNAAGSVPRTLQSKIEETISVKDFGAIGDGVTDDTTFIQNAINDLSSGQILFFPPGTYKITSKLDLTSIPEFSGIHCDGIISAEGNIDAVEISGLNVSLRIKKITGTSSGTGLICRTVLRGKIEVDDIRGFNTACVKVIGKYNYDGSGIGLNGVIYTTFNFRYLFSVGDGVYVTTEYNDGPGYVNENYFNIQWIDANYGIRFVQGSGQTDWFNGNHINTPGLENITTDGIHFEYARRNTVISPRFENIGQYEVYEDSNCQQNFYIIGYSNFHSKWNMNGLTARIIGHGRSDDGGVIYKEAWQNQLGTWVYFADMYHADLLPNTMFFNRNHVGRTIFDQFFCAVKDEDGNYHNVGQLDPLGSEEVIGETGIYQVQSDISYLRVSTSAGALDLQMPEVQEVEGNMIRLDYYLATNDLAIRASWGSVHIAAGAIQQGIWELLYHAGAWKATRLGGNQFATTPNVFYGEIVWNPGSLADATGETSSDITVTNAQVDNKVEVYPPYSTQGVKYFGWVNSAGNVRIRIENNTGGVVDLPSGTWKVKVDKL